jgi:outer membrane protein OmpA-like peptidoglycan-associated protein
METMLVRFRTFTAALAASAFISGSALVTSTGAFAQGPFTPHEGLTITRAYTSQYGPDAEEFNVIRSVSPDGVLIDYNDTRGIAAQRLVRSVDRRGASTYLIGFDPSVPRVIPNTTSLGVSSALLNELRTRGSAPVSLMYDRKLSTIPGVLTVVNDNSRMPVMVENQIVNMPVLIARGSFQKGNRSGTGYFYFLSDVNNPVTVEYRIKFSWENAMRTTRTVRVSAGRSEQAAMEQTLRTIRKLDVYGIHFDFDKASIRPQARSLITDIATTMKNNPTWTIAIRGHTDSLGAPDYNLNLSARRAEAVKQAIVSGHGINPGRISTSGAGMSEPKAPNDTLQGRAQNRRVELTRTDR